MFAFRIFSIITVFLVGASAQLPWPKRGLPFNEPSMIENFDGGDWQVNWAYNWDSETDDLPGYLEFVPMLWSADQNHVPQWATNAQAALDSGSGHLLSFNEPDSAAQANMDPGYAAQMYMQYMQPFADKASLGGPAVSNGPNGLTWLSNFLDSCDALGCTIDFIPFHWYDSATNFAYFYNYMGQAQQTAQGRQIWITEFAATGTTAQQVNFLNTVMPWLDQQDNIYRYAWFGAQPGQLVNADASLTAVGSAYMAQSY